MNILKEIEGLDLSNVRFTFEKNFTWDVVEKKIKPFSYSYPPSCTLLTATYRKLRTNLSDFIGRYKGRYIIFYVDDGSIYCGEKGVICIIY